MESSDRLVGGGASRGNCNGEQVATGKQYKVLRQAGWQDKAVEHTLKYFKRIEAGRVSKWSICWRLTSYHCVRNIGDLIRVRPHRYLMFAAIYLTPQPLRNHMLHTPWSLQFL